MEDTWHHSYPKTTSTTYPLSPNAPDKMPIIKNFTLPASAKLLEVPDAPNAKLFLAFISGDDVITKQPWCPDVRAALPHIDAAFTAPDAPTVALVSVGEKPVYVSETLVL